MKIGLTYDLRSEYLAMGLSELETAEFDRPDTVDAIQEALVELGHETDRIGHARQLVGRLAAGDRWDLVFNICEGLYGPAREAQVPAILDVYGIAYTFSDPLVLAVSLEKAMTKTLLKAAGVPTTAFAVVRDADDIPAIGFGYPVFAKPIAEGTGKGITPASRIHSPEQLAEVCRELLSVHRQPVLIEPYLPGREFTVGVWGTGRDSEVIGTLEIVLRAHAEEGVYSYANKEQCEEYVDYLAVSAERDATVREAETIALDAWKALGGRDAGRIDLRCDSQGLVQVMELNPLAGLHPEHSDLPMICTALGIPYVRLIERIVQSACERIGADRHPAGKPLAATNGQLASRTE
ncbi:MAG: D-alanine--D-alanine ligase family protein [Thermoguttaceae bacterium]|jgi:D-alanine-D-alanine ligase